MTAVETFLFQETHSSFVAFAPQSIHQAIDVMRDAVLSVAQVENKELSELIRKQEVLLVFLRKGLWTVDVFVALQRVAGSR